MNIPSMCAQPLIGNLLAERAAKVESGLAIVEVGAWFCACTRFMAKAVKPAVKIHVYDNFKVASRREVEKLKKRGFDYRLGEDVFDVVKGYMYGLPVILHQGQFSKIDWNGPKIGLLIMDGAKEEGAFDKVIESLEPFFVKDMTAVFMDFWFDKLKGSQVRYIEQSGRWEFVGSLRGSDEAEFIYRGKP